MIHLKRVYEPPDPADGFRVLVERLWPRGLSKSRAQVDLWLKDVAPSSELRTWYGHEVEKWEEFQRRYRAELQNNPAVEQLRQLRQDKPVVTFVYAAHDTEHNSAVTLRAFLEEGASL